MEWEEVKKREKDKAIVEENIYNVNNECYSFKLNKFFLFNLIFIL